MIKTSRKVLVALMIVALFMGISGAKEEKVTICHNGHEINVGDDALQSHLKKGDTVGTCTPPAPSPELSTSILMTTGILGLVGFSRLKKIF